MWYVATNGDVDMEFAALDCGDVAARKDHYGAPAFDDDSHCQVIFRWPEDYNLIPSFMASIHQDHRVLEVHNTCDTRMCLVRVYGDASAKYTSMRIFILLTWVILSIVFRITLLFLLTSNGGIQRQTTFTCLSSR